ncbi:tumor necrosis factor receptor superfamily member 11B-like [Genypterus blacodes]|uniref:tumor necrosis factor receptor superfamily member 11B-like n=1 Tax=Genypterus blacodes TaxID=154954 RepID=UPI003F767314
MFFSLPMSLLFGLLHGALEVDSTPQYERHDPVTGAILTCDMCPPGTHMAAHCTATTPTKCAQCKEQHFTELWNYLPRCLYCNNFCTHNQEVETECSPLNNRVCRCTEGYYWTDDFCIRHAQCGPGHGVKTTGTSSKNTVCETCADGFFSNSSSALMPCVKHLECASSRETALLPGTSSCDTVCGTCEDLANGEAQRTCLKRLLAHHRISVVKLKTFYTRNIREGRHHRNTAPRLRSRLLKGIGDWLGQAQGEQLKRLPEMLRESKLNCLAERLQNSLEEAEQRANCSSILDNELKRT